MSYRPVSYCGHLCPSDISNRCFRFVGRQGGRAMPCTQAQKWKPAHFSILLHQASRENLIRDLPVTRFLFSSLSLQLLFIHLPQQAHLRKTSLRLEQCKFVLSVFGSSFFSCLSNIDPSIGTLKQKHNGRYTIFRLQRN